MKVISIIPIVSTKVIDEKDELIDVIIASITKEGITLQDNDILVIASKVVSMAEKEVIDYSKISPTETAKKLAIKARIPAEFAQIILDECDNQFIGTVPGAITTVHKYGLLANAGADQSNIGENRAIILPKDCNKSAKNIHIKLREISDKFVGIVIADSRTMPVRLGTVGCALGTYGFKSVTDERGKLDLFNRPIHITTRAIADQLATAAELVMGETNERVPFVIIRGYPIERVTPDNERNINTLITKEDCMFLGPLLPCLEFKKKSDNNEN